MKKLTLLFTAFLFMALTASAQTAKSFSISTIAKEYVYEDMGGEVWQTWIFKPKAEMEASLRNAGLVFESSAYSHVLETSDGTKVLGKYILYVKDSIKVYYHYSGKNCVVNGAEIVFPNKAVLKRFIDASRKEGLEDNGYGGYKMRMSQGAIPMMEINYKSPLKLRIDTWA